MKFKNIKKKSPPVSGKKEKSPSNSRTITEVFNFHFSKFNNIKFLKIYRESLKIFVVLIFVVAVVIVGLDFQENLQIKQGVDSQREALIKDLSFWEGFISKHQNYPDAYFQTSILEYKLGNTSQAKMYAERGLSLDPNSANGRKIEVFLNK